MTHLDCPLIPETVDRKGFCSLKSCQKSLTGRRTKWCSDKCVKYYLKVRNENHLWNSARKAAFRRDTKCCVKCGATESEAAERDGRRFSHEINHIVPVNSSKRKPFSCLNHLDGLETLCHRCHVQVTNQQRRERKEKKECQNAQNVDQDALNSSNASLVKTEETLHENSVGTV